MRHEWEWTEPTEGHPLLAPEHRKCVHCGAVQHKEERPTWYMRSQGYDWRPLVGKCTGNRNTGTGSPVKDLTKRSKGVPKVKAVTKQKKTKRVGGKTANLKSKKKVKTGAKAEKVVAKSGKAGKTAKKGAGKVAKRKKVKLISIGRTEIFTRLAEAAEISNKQAKLAMAELESIITEAVGKKGSGLFKFPGLFKVQSVHVPAKPARKGTNPFTGEPAVFKAKPATTKVKLRPMKKLKEAALG